MSESRQHSIDLMPASIRARSQAGLRMGQFLAVTVVSMTLTIAAATHSKLMLSTAQDRLFDTSRAAEEVFATEARASELRHDLEAINAFTGKYERLAFPLQVSDVLASVVNLLPESVTLDEIDLNAGARVIGRGPRTQAVESVGGEQGGGPPRVLTGEISGFAANDQHIAELVGALEATAPFQNVSLDFSRSRRVNDHDAREFRLSFRIDLDDTYQVTHVDEGSIKASRHQGIEGKKGGISPSKGFKDRLLDALMPRSLDASSSKEVANADD